MSVDPMSSSFNDGIYWPYYYMYITDNLSSQMQFCPDKEAKCTENGQLLGIISSTVQVTYM